ncbi:MAG: tetratricopeptide repeat protein [Candidatus Riflebacteria bacterium]|nr:tetratricopeptide repeat protein [Candidatus Riflebacteria bacterium]
MAIAFSPVLRNGFTNLDEPAMILENPWVQELSWESVRAMFTRSFHYTYSPLAFLLFAVEKRVFGLEPAWFHGTTLLLHLAATLLVGAWVTALTGDRRVALGTALVFGLHPLQVESVAWATGQRTVLFGLFFFAALAAFTRFEAERRPGWHRLAMGCLAASLLAKGLAFTFPVVILLQRWFAPPPHPAARPADLAPAVALSGAAALVAWGAAAPQMPVVDTWERILVAGHGFLFSLASFLWPVGLSCAYPYPAGAATGFPTAFQAAPFLLAGLGLAVVAGRRRFPGLAFGAGFFAITLLPVSQLVTVGVRITASDHFLYVPLAGLAFVLARTAVAAEGRWSRRLPWLAVPLLAALALLTWHQCQVWQDSRTLFGHTLARYPDLAFARHQLGVALLREEAWEEAAAQFTRLLEADPADLDARVGRAAARVGAGDWAAARADLAEVRRRDPAHPGARALEAVLPPPP